MLEQLDSSPGSSQPELARGAEELRRQVHEGVMRFGDIVESLASAAPAGTPMHQVATEVLDNLA